VGTFFGLLSRRSKVSTTSWATSSRDFITPGLSGNITPLRSFTSTRSGFSFISQLCASSPRMASEGSQASARKACGPPLRWALERSAAKSCS
jgi:hypothetical protein